MDEKLKEKLNSIFDINGAEITKTQHCPKGRWVFTLLMTALFFALYGVCMWGASLFYGSMLIFMYCLLTAVLAFALLRIWFAFGVDVTGQKFAERILFVRNKGNRYYYTQSRHIKKFEYSGGFIAAAGNTYDKFENKSDYSPLAGRLNKALQRRSSLYATMTPDFWFESIRQMEYTISETAIEAHSREGSVRIEWTEDGKISKIEYVGNGYYLYDSLSPVRVLDGKLPGRYRITYTFAVRQLSYLDIDEIFGEAIKELKMPRPNAMFVRVQNAAGTYKNDLPDDGQKE